MKHYKDSNNKVYGFAADGSQDHLKPVGLVEITDKEAEILGLQNYEEQRQKDIAAMDYIRQRVMHYPNLGEFVDAWVKGDNAALEAYRQECLNVKARFPKPEGF